MGFLFFPMMPMGLRWAALRAAGAPLQRSQQNTNQKAKEFEKFWGHCKSSFHITTCQVLVAVEIKLIPSNFNFNFKTRFNNRIAGMSADNVLG